MKSFFTISLDKEVTAQYQLSLFKVCITNKTWGKREKHKILCGAQQIDKVIKKNSRSNINPQHAHLILAIMGVPHPTF